MTTFFVFFNWGIIDIKHCISFRCTKQWSNICIFGKINTTVDLVNICHYLSLSNFYLWWELLRFSFSNFHICSTVLLTVVNMLYIIRPWLIYFRAGRLYLLTPLSIFSCTPSPTVGSSNFLSILRPSCLLSLWELLMVYIDLLWYIYLMVVLGIPSASVLFL